MAKAGQAHKHNAGDKYHFTAITKEKAKPEAKSEEGKYLWKKDLRKWINLPIS